MGYRTSWATIRAISFDSANRYCDRRCSLPISCQRCQNMSSTSSSSAHLSGLSAENYLNHPTFGLLFRICYTEQDQELFSTLYAQRLFFIVTMKPTGLQFESISRSTAKVVVEAQMRSLRRNGDSAIAAALLKTHQQLF
jgi:PII interaction protein X